MLVSNQLSTCSTGVKFKDLLYIVILINLKTVMLRLRGLVLIKKKRGGGLRVEFNEVYLPCTNSYMAGDSYSR